MSKTDAQGGYVALVSASQPQWQQWKLESGGVEGAAGPVFSRPVHQQAGNGMMEPPSQTVSLQVRSALEFIDICICSNVIVVAMRDLLWEDYADVSSLENVGTSLCWKYPFQNVGRK